MFSEDTVDVRRPWSVWHLYMLLCLMMVGGLFGSWYGFSASPTTSSPSQPTISAGSAVAAPKPEIRSRAVMPQASQTPKKRTNNIMQTSVSLADVLANTPVGPHLRGFTLGEPVSYGQLKVFPVRLAQTLPRHRTPISIDESFRKRKVRVTEEGAGTVPFISLRKRRSPPIFVMTGEIFLGAKQDRISKHDLLLPRRPGRFRVPVYCVEQGRWNYNSSRFRSGKTVGTYRLRRAVTKKVSQGAVWGEVSKKTGQLGARTRTDTMAASYRSRLFRKKSPAYLRKFKSFAKRRSQSQGFVSLVQGRITSVELFANPKLFQNMWPKLLKAMVLDAVDKKYKPSLFGENQITGLLQRLAVARYRRTRTPGIGKETLISDTQVSGTLLVHNKRMVHLTLFPDDPQSSQERRQRRFRRLNRQRQRRGNRKRLDILGNLGGERIPLEQALQIPNTHGRVSLPPRRRRQLRRNLRMNRRLRRTQPTHENRKRRSR